MKLLANYPYFYETHLHTAQGSACAGSRGADMARACKEAGYTGMIVTDHNWGGNTAVDRKKPWQSWVEEFAEGYLEAKRTGDAIGLDVFFGYEAGYQGTEFLIYGVDIDFLLKHPGLKEARVEEQYELVHQAGGMVIHAHPFREEPYIPQIRLYPEWVDGVEGVNATHSNPMSRSHNDKSFDDKAIAYAKEHRLPMTAGSDVHTTAVFGGGMAFRHRLESVQDFIREVCSGGDYVLTNGDCWYTREGEKITE